MFRSSEKDKPLRDAIPGDICQLLGFWTASTNCRTSSGCL